MRNNNLISVAALLALVTLIASGCVTKTIPVKSKEAAEANAQLGIKYLQRGELDQAKVKLEKALEQDETNARAHSFYGQLQHRVEQDESARVHFNKAIALEPDEAAHRNSYGVFLCKIEEYDAAVVEFDAAANNPYYKTPEFALDNAGLCMLESKQYDLASNYLRKALRVNTKFANAYLHMAELLRKQSKLTVADAYYQRFLAYGRDSAESLLLGLQINRDLGKQPQAEQYASRLLNEFPESIEAGEYLAQPIQ